MSQYCVTSVNDFQKAVKTTVTQRQPAAIIYDSAEKSYTNNRREKRHDWYDLALKNKNTEENQQRSRIYEDQFNPIIRRKAPKEQKINT